MNVIGSLVGFILGCSMLILFAAAIVQTTGLLDEVNRGT